MSQKTSPLSSDPVHQSRPMLSTMRRWMDRFTLAWLFLTRVPLPKWWNAPLPVEAEEVETEKTKADKGDKANGMTPLADTVRTWPLVGLFIGAFTGLALWAGAKLGLHPIAAGFVALMAGALLTGALHEDGLADVADGFGGGTTKAKKLAIMKDSHIGTYGVLALLLVTGFKAACLGGFNGPGLAAGALVGAHVLSRAMMPLLMAFMPPVRSGGLARGAGVPSRDDAVVTAIIGVLLGLLVLGLQPGALAAVLALSGAAVVAWVAHRQIGGYTGDVLGAAQQVAEALVLAGMAGAFRTVFYI